jgi:hypothetical protein
MRLVWCPLATAAHSRPVVTPAAQAVGALGRQVRDYTGSRQFFLAGMSLAHVSMAR